MNKIEINLDNFIAKYIFNQFRNLSSGFFEIIEDLRDDDFITEEMYAKLRKRWLDKAGICGRALEDQLKEVTFVAKDK